MGGLGYSHFHHFLSALITAPSNQQGDWPCVRDSPVHSPVHIHVHTCVADTVEPLYKGHQWDPAGSPVWKGVPKFRGRFVHSLAGTADSVLIRELSLIQSVLYKEVPLYVQYALDNMPS